MFFASVGPCWILRVSVCLSHNDCAWVEVLSQLGMRDGAGFRGSWMLAQGGMSAPAEPSPTWRCLGHGARRAEKGAGCAWEGCRV